MNAASTTGIYTDGEAPPERTREEELFARRLSAAITVAVDLVSAEALALGESVPTSQISSEWAEWLGLNGGGFTIDEAAARRIELLRRDKVVQPAEDARNMLGQPAAAALPQDSERGSFAERVATRKVDLFALIEHGIPAVEYLAASERMFVRGKRHQLPASRKLGKSISTLAHSVRMTLAGAAVVILDRENGRDEYARRLDQIMASLDLGGDDRGEIRKRLSYYEFPKLRNGDGADFAAMCAGTDLVVFDSQRKFLTDLGLAEDDSDDYAKFMEEAIDPLFEAGIATLVLDNTGHLEKDRARGASAKGDLHEVLFHMQSVEPFSLARVGKIRLLLEAGDSRFGNEGAWTMTIGGGVFGAWELETSAEQIAEEQQHRKAERQAREHDARSARDRIVETYWNDHQRGIPKSEFEAIFAAERDNERGAVTLARRVYDDAISLWLAYEKTVAIHAAEDDPAQAQTATARPTLAIAIGDRSRAKQLIPSIHAGSPLTIDPNGGNGDRPAVGPSERTVPNSPFAIEERRVGDRSASPATEDEEWTEATDEDTP